MSGIEVVPFRAMHLIDADIQWPDYVGDIATMARDFEGLGPAWSGFDGAWMGSAGVVDHRNGMGDGWLVLARRDWSASQIRHVVRAIKERMAGLPFRRLQVEVHSAFPQSVRFAEMLGFAHEGPLHSWTPDGSDYVRMARWSYM